jgi:hypothetical protein
MIFAFWNSVEVLPKVLKLTVPPRVTTLIIRDSEDTFIEKFLNGFEFGRHN